MNIIGMDLNLLAVFHALMTERSVTRAAVSVGLSQPALSNALGRLRHQLDDPLFVRGRKAMVPTPRALELAPEIGMALEHIRAAFQSPEFKPGSSMRAFRLATTDEIELSLLPAVIQKLEASAPGVSASCTRLQRVFRLPQAELESGALDFAIGCFQLPNHVDTGCFAEELYEEKFVCIARAGHPAFKGRLSLRRFCELKHVVTYYQGEGPGMIDRILARRGLRRNAVLSLPHFLPLPSIVAASDLVATVPERVVRILSGPLRLQSFKCPVPLPRVKVSIVWHARTHTVESHKWFRDLILEAGQKLAG